MNEFRFICALLILDERVLKILSVTERNRYDARLTRELQGHRLRKLKIRGVCVSLCIQRIVWENHRWVTIWFEINFPTSNHGLLSMLKCVANLSLVPILKSAWRRLVKLFETVKITETKRRQNGLKIGPRCGHVWLTSYPGPRAGFFLPLRGSGSLISCRENSRKPLRPEYLRVDFLQIIGIL